MNIFRNNSLKPSTVIAIIILTTALIAILGLIDALISLEKILIGLVGLLALQLLIDSEKILGLINDAIRGIKYDTKMIRLGSRSDPEFERFSDFARYAKEIMVIGNDLAFMASADGWFIRNALQLGVSIKLLMADPDTDGYLARAINLQDERNTPQRIVHDHILSARNTLETLELFASEIPKCKLEIRARADVPKPALTLIDPTTPNGKIRVEIKPYKGNHGEVPYFLLDRKNTWYDTFLQKYYVRLWEDSKILYKSK